MARIIDGVQNNITGEHIKEARVKAVLSQKGLSAKLETEAVYVCRGSISRIEKGKRTVTDIEINAISTYLPSELRHSKTTAAGTTVHLWNGLNIVADVGASGSITGSYLRGAGLIATDIGGERSYNLYNAHGDVVQLAGEDSSIDLQYDYDAYGNQREIPGQDTTTPDINPFRYSGEYLDFETNYIYLRARYYDTTTGRFLTEDPIRDGMNWYGYCAGNPVRFTDPTGLFILDPLVVVLTIKAVQTAMSSAKTSTSSSSGGKATSSYSQSKSSGSKPATTTGSSPASNTSSKDQMPELLDAIGMRESSDNYGNDRNPTQWGRYQLGESALVDVGFMDENLNWTPLAASYGVTSIETFLSAPRAQDFAMEMYLDVNWQYSKNRDMLKYIGQSMNDIEITVSGLLAASHLVGNGKLLKAFAVGDLYSEWDANLTTAAEYMEQFGGYYLEKYEKQLMGN